MADLQTILTDLRIPPAVWARTLEFASAGISSSFIIVTVFQLLLLFVHLVIASTTN